MPCNDVIGDWIRAILTNDSAEEIEIDPAFSITNPSGNLTGRFNVTGELSFPIVCHDTGPRIRIEFTRTHLGTPTTKTEYSGRVIAFGQRAVVGIIKGRFKRVVTRPDGRFTVTTGDWETEKPT